MDAKEALKLAEKSVGAPVGTIVAFAGNWDERTRNTLDDRGWLLCDGQALSPAQ